MEGHAESFLRQADRENLESGFSTVSGLNLTSLSTEKGVADIIQT